VVGFSIRHHIQLQRIVDAFLLAGLKGVVVGFRSC
jgi:hypothetical protein